MLMTDLVLIIIDSNLEILELENLFRMNHFIIKIMR
ncbi:MAG: hypothetical protein RLZZ46_763 [Bacteroidota bacterium]|jgi:hypothetical protein